MLYSHFTLEERKMLYQLKKDGLSIRKIAEYLDRNPSSVSRELKRNKGKHGYRPAKAHLIAQNRKTKSKCRQIKPGSDSFIYIVDKLQLFWSPETICGKWAQEHADKKPLHYSTIYRYIHYGLFPDISPKENLRRRGHKSKKKHGGQMTIHPNRLIREWPEEIRNRSRLGDWEGDTITGKIGSGLIDTLVDRKSRYLLAGKVESKAAPSNRKVLENLLKDMPVQSISFDNGVEFAEHERIEKTLSTKVYFADPHSPWQRGSNENTNGLLRFFFPRGSDFRLITQEQVDYVVALLNNRPRKCLGWRTPNEVFHESVALT